MGRHKEFDPSKAIDDALLVFWRKGYFDASMKDLIDGTGVNNYGLYSVFGSKRGLFLETLKRYSANVTGDLVRLIDMTEPTTDGVAWFFDKASRKLSPSGQKLGCFVCNCMVEQSGSDPEIAKLVASNRKMLTDAFERLLLSATPAPNPSDVRSTSNRLATGLYTLGLLIRARSSKQIIDDHIAALAASV